MNPLHQLLSHLYVLAPVLDNDKHYWVGDDEVAKLLRHGEGWLAAHPEREAITRRYLKHQRSLVTDALAQLVDEGGPHPDETAATHEQEEAKVERALSLNEQRLGTVLAVLKASGAQSVLDLGCGEGRLLRMLLQERQFTRIVGLDVSHRVLEMAAENLCFDRLPTLQKERIKLLHGSLMYRDERLAGFDSAAVVEVIEHLDPPRLAAFERVLFECARPGTVVLTTPNREYNVKWETLPAGKFRHRDHRFEWTRAEFQDWASRVAARFGYRVRFLPVGPEDALVGAPTQMGVFTRESSQSPSPPSRFPSFRLWQDSKTPELSFIDQGAFSDLWNAVVYFGGRYELTLQVYVEIDYAKHVVVKPTTPAKFYLKEVGKIEILPDGRVSGNNSNGWELDEDRWNKLVAAKGDWSVLGIPIKKGKPVPNFDYYVQRWREPRVRVK